MLAMFNGKPIFGPRGPAGPDGNPIGTIISYMGTKAPNDYLICDGSIYNISDYSELAEFFKAQFGSEAYFGGDGTTTFAVPDLRNLFLRGFHGASDEQLSGDVGVKQEATQHVDIRASEYNASIAYSVPNHYTMFTDTKLPEIKQAAISYQGIHPEYPVPAYYTSRPVNMAVLYCIKAAETDGSKLVGTTVSLSVSEWVNGVQTIPVTGVLANDAVQLIQPIPAIASQSAYYAAGINCIGQAADSLTFAADIVPTENLTVHIVIQEVIV